MLSSVFCDALEKQKNCDDDYERVFDVINAVLELSQIARQGGPQALEDAVSCLMDEKTAATDDRAAKALPYRLYGANRQVYQICMMIASACPPENIIAAAEAQYFSSNPEGREALGACMAMEGCLSILSDEPPSLIRLRLLAMLPEEIADQYMDWMMSPREED